MKQLLGISGVILLLWVVTPREKHEVLLDFLDVGQGDAILLTFDNDFQVLIDGGPDQAVLGELRTVMPAGDRSIDWLILSHDDADHIMGLFDVVDSYEIGQVFTPSYPERGYLYQHFAAALAEKEIRLIQAEDPQEFTIGKSELKFSPDRAGLDGNNHSLIVQLRHGDFSALFTGDIEAEAEQAFIAYYGKRLRSNLLKVGHHGSRTSSTPLFLQNVDPDIAVIQAGRHNTFGHPHPITLYRLGKHVDQMYRTDISGTLNFALKEGGLWYRPFGQKWENVYNFSYQP